MMMPDAQQKKIGSNGGGVIKPNSVYKESHFILEFIATFFMSFILVGLVTDKRATKVILFFFRN